MTRTTKSNPQTAGRKTIVDQIEDIKSRLSKALPILTQGISADFDTQITCNLEVSKVVDPVEPLVDTLVYSIRLSAVPAAETAAEAVENGYEGMLNIGRGEVELDLARDFRILSDRIGKFVSCLDTTQAHFAGRPDISEFSLSAIEKEYGQTTTRAKNAKCVGNILGMRWQDARKEAERVVDKAGYTGFEKLREAVGCAKNTLRKAIDHSPKLRKAEAEHKATSRTPKAVSLTDEVVATYEQRSKKPSLSDTETNEIIDELIKDVAVNHPEKLEQTKTKLAGMDAEDRRQLAQEYRNQSLNQPETPRQYKKV